MSVHLRKLSCHTTNALEIVKVMLFFPPNQMDSRAALPFFVATAHDGRLKKLSLSSIACLEIDTHTHTHIMPSLANLALCDNLIVALSSLLSPVSTLSSLLSPSSCAFVVVKNTLVDALHERVAQVTRFS